MCWWRRSWPGHLLEAIFAYCLGCKIFAVLIRSGVLPEEMCLDCNDISTRVGAGVS
jgi:hypothetical protein